MDMLVKDNIERAVALTAAWLASPANRAGGQDAAEFLKSSYRGISKITEPAPEPEAAPEYTPIVSARQSLSRQPEFIISMIDGKPYKTLRRHLRTHGITPEEYRRRYNLKADYPMVAKAYSDSRSSLAKQSGLGRHRGQVVK